MVGPKSNSSAPLKNKSIFFNMGNLFGKEKPLKEVLRENKRMINKAIRELER